MSRVFAFDPRSYAADFASQDYVHIPQGVSAEFFQQLTVQVDQHLDSQRLEKFALGGKQQALYEFPSAELQQEFASTIAAVAGLEPDQIVISERHIKCYEPDADPNPMPHKDRLATQIAVGITVRRPSASRLVLYPDDDRSINPFQSWAELRASLPAEQLPTTVLKSARRVVIHDQPRDVTLFRGNEIWHARENGAGTVLLYFKLNAFHSDPLGEDPRTEHLRQQTQRLAQFPDEQLVALRPVLARRVECLQSRYNCVGQQVVGAFLGDAGFLVVSEREWDLLFALSSAPSVDAWLQRWNGAESHADGLILVRRLAQRGIVDLLPAGACAPAQLASREGHARR